MSDSESLTSVNLYNPSFKTSVLGERVRRLSNEQRDKLRNFDSLPYGEVRKVLKVLDPLFGNEVQEGKKFVVRVCEERTVRQSQTGTFVVYAEDKQQARRVAQEALDENDLEDLEDYKEEDEWSDGDVDYERCCIIELTEAD